MGGLLVVTLLVVACGAPPKDAIEMARDAVEAAPRDPAPRIALAHLYLMKGRGDLAGVMIDQAIDRGADANELLPERAEALQIAGKTAKLLALPIPDSPPARARVLASKAKAQPSDAAFMALYEALDSADLPALRAWLDGEPAAGRAREHHACLASANPVVFTWDHRPPSNDSEMATREGRVVRVRTSAELQAAARTAADGATIEVQAGDYSGAVAQWRQNNIIVRGVGGRPHIKAAGHSVEDRDAWLFSGSDVTIENVEISGAHSRQNKNGASIRFVGRNLTLRHVYLHDSDNGLLTGNTEPDSRILIEYSELARNGDGAGYAHNAYVGVSGEVAMRFSYSHDAEGGHLFKSRARRTIVGYNYFADNDGASSRVIDLPDGGRARIVGNVIDKGASAVNKAIIAFGTENRRYEDNSLQVVGNTFYNRYLNAVAVDNRFQCDTHVSNNLFAGAPLVRLEGVGQLTGNVDRVDHGLLVNPREGDYSLLTQSAAIDAGADLTSVGIDALSFEYVHPVSARVRSRVWTIDAGAYERCGF